MRAGDYTRSPALNRLARLLAPATAARLLLTEAVRAPASMASLPNGAPLIDLGKHRLRDLLEPEAS